MPEPGPFDDIIRQMQEPGEPEPPQPEPSLSDDLLERGYIEGWALALTFATEEEFRAGRWGTAIACLVLSLMIQAVVIYWRKIKRTLGPRFAATASASVHDFRFWVGTLAIFLMVVTFSPFVEQQRWPFSQPPTSGPSGVVGGKDTPAPPDAKTQVVGGHYTKEERDALIRGLTNLRDLLNTEAVPAHDLVDAALKSGLQDVPALEKKLIDAQNKVNQATNALRAAVINNYRDELEPPIVDSSNDAFELIHSLGEAIDNNSALRSEPQAIRSGVLTKDMERIRRLNDRYADWAGVSLQHVNAKIRALRDKS